MRPFNNIWNDVFNEFFNEFSDSRDVAVRNSGLSQYRRPIADVLETEKEYIVTLELPGVEKNEIEVNTNNGMLEIKVEKTDETKHKHSYARRQQGYYRALTLPENADPKNIQASYNNGVLEIKLPKTKTEKSTRIPIK